ncbi:MAG: competence/damage-inducible protein A [Candidatus Methanofastidiosia archaeon]
MPIGIIVIGDEILQGFTKDTNSNWLSKRLWNLGYRVERVVVIGDEISEISETLRDFLKRFDTIFVCGGLGPTPDDKTFEALGIALRRELVKSEKALKRLREVQKFLYERGMEKSLKLSRGAEKMAFVPEDSVILKNSLGAAPGLLIHEKNSKIFVLPGVPLELKSIFSEEIEKKYLKPLSKKYVGEILLKAHTEASLYKFLQELEKKHPEVSIGSYPDILSKEVTIRVIGDEDKVKEVLREVEKGLNLQQSP